MNKRQIMDMLLTTCPYESPFNDELSHELLGYMFKEWKESEKLLSKAFDSKKERTKFPFSKQNIDEYLSLAMLDYLKSQRIPSRRKQRIKDQFQIWRQRIRDEYEVIPDEIEFPEYQILDQGIELIKALHEPNGLTKKELSEMLNISKKSIQNKLRALDPSLSKIGSSRNEELHLGGQILQVEIKGTEDSNDKRLMRFRTEDTLHPLIFQSNVTQVYLLLQAFHIFENSEPNWYNSVRDLALDVWYQLSGYCKQRLKETFGEKDKEFFDYLDALDKEIEEERIVEFKTEREIANYESLEERLMLAWKGNRLFNACIMQNGEKTQYERIRLNSVSGCGFDAIAINVNTQTEEKLWISSGSLCEDIKFNY